MALTSGALAQPPPGGGYGPCCPLVKGQKPPTAHTSAAGMTVTGPRYVCQTKPVSLAINDATHRINALEAAGSLLAPVRLFAMVGASVEWGGNRQIVVTRGPRRVELTLGSHAVTIYDGADTQMVSWPLCPRLVEGISYAPLRALAEALALVVSYQDGTVAVQETGTPGGAVMTPPMECPADRVDGALGVTIVRSPADSNFGAGAGIVEVKPGGLAENFGVRAGDVIIGCDDQPVKCPKDLDQILTQLKTTGGTIQTLVVARGKDKLTLTAQPGAEQ
jgi:membrane-associated protease RseP (regulator of RpoE activity)